VARASTRKRVGAVVGFLLAVLIVHAVFARLFPNGLAVRSNDAATYVQTVRNLMGHHEVLSGGHSPTHFPPGYPIALATSQRLSGASLTATAVWLHALGWVAMVVLVAAMCWVITRNAWLTTLGALLAMTSSPALGFYTSMLSEAVFLPLMLGGLLLLATQDEDASGIRLYGSAVLIGLAAVTRYAGLALIPAGGLTLLASRRVRRAMIFCVVASVPMATLVLWHWHAGEPATDRQIVLHLFGAVELRRLAESLSYLAVPLDVPLWLAAALGVSTLAAGLFTWRRDDRARQTLVFAAACYLTIVVVTRALFDAATHFDRRMMFPFWVLAMISFVGWLPVPSRRLRPRITYAMVACFTVLLLVRSYDVVVSMKRFETDPGYVSQRWAESPGLAFAEHALDRGTLITNDPELISYRLDRNSREVPRRIDPHTLQARPEYAADLRAICEQVQSGRASVEFFDGQARLYLVNQHEFEDACPLASVSRLSDATVFVRNAKAP